MKKILIVEDESLVALDLSQCVEYLGYSVVGVVATSKDALALVHVQDVDLVLMDICLKGEIDGIDTAKEIKNYNDSIEIIYSTALSGEEDIKRAVATNPSAYLVKPINTKALQAAIEIAFIGKSKMSKVIGDIILDEEFSYDSKNFQLICNGSFIALTKRENELLSLLIENTNQVVTFYDIENYIWPQKNFNVNTTRALVSRLRAKLKYKIIETVPSIGYKIVRY